MNTHSLSRFVDAQDSVYSQALKELRAGKKTSHWMWFIFPQLRGLGHSEMARHFGLDGADEASAYLRHDILGPRLEECVRVVLLHTDKDAHQIFGSPDDLKFRSFLTLFAGVHSESSLFSDGIDQFYAGQPDANTLRLLGR